VAKKPAGPKWTKAAFDEKYSAAMLKRMYLSVCTPEAYRLDDGTAVSWTVTVFVGTQKDEGCDFLRVTKTWYPDKGDRGCGARKALEMCLPSLDEHFAPRFGLKPGLPKGV